MQEGSVLEGEHKSVYTLEEVDLFLKYSIEQCAAKKKFAPAEVIEGLLSSMVFQYFERYKTGDTIEDAQVQTIFYLIWFISTNSFTLPMLQELDAQFSDMPLIETRQDMGKYAQIFQEAYWQKNQKRSGVLVGGWASGSAGPEHDRGIDDMDEWMAVLVQDVVKSVTGRSTYAISPALQFDSREKRQAS